MNIPGNFKKPTISSQRTQDEKTRVWLSVPVVTLVFLFYSMSGFTDEQAPMQLALLYNELNLKNPTQRNVYEVQTLAHLFRMRVVMKTYYQEGGDWPNKKFIEEELAETVRMKRLPPNRFILKSYEHSSDGFIAIIDDARPGASDIRFSGGPLKNRMYFVQP